MCQMLYNNQNWGMLQSTLVELPFTTVSGADRSSKISTNPAGSNIKLCVSAVNFSNIINSCKYFYFAHFKLLFHL